MAKNDEKIKLELEEEVLLEAFESEEFQSGLPLSRKKTIGTAAAQTFKKDHRMNIRISGEDLTAIQRRAIEQGMSYQTLIASIIHKHTSRSLYDAIVKNVVDTNN